MSHPESCKDPCCNLSYRQHLLSVAFSANALPTRRFTRTPGQPDEPVVQTNIRERRWERDTEAYKRLRKEGFNLPSVDGAAARERMAVTEHGLEHGPVAIDYGDPT